MSIAVVIVDLHVVGEIAQRPRLIAARVSRYSKFVLGVWEGSVLLPKQGDAEEYASKKPLVVFAYRGAEEWTHVLAMPFNYCKVIDLRYSAVPQEVHIVRKDGLLARGAVHW